MNEFFAAIGAVLLWRLVLGLVGSVALAAALALLFQEFTGGYAVATVLLGTAFGVYWQSRNASGLTLTQRVAEPRIGRSIAFAGLAFVGLLVGGSREKSCIPRPWELWPCCWELHWSLTGARLAQRDLSPCESGPLDHSLW
jgi:hypothetical protein